MKIHPYLNFDGDTEQAFRPLFDSGIKRRRKIGGGSNVLDLQSDAQRGGGFGQRRDLKRRNRISKKG